MMKQKLKDETKQKIIYLLFNLPVIVLSSLNLDGGFALRTYFIIILISYLLCSSFMNNKKIILIIVIVNFIILISYLELKFS